MAFLNRSDSHGKLFFRSCVESLPTPPKDDSWYDISQLWVGTFFYGIYLVLFCICVYILLHRPHTRANTILLVTAIAMVTLSSILTVLTLVLGAAEIDDIDEIPFDRIQNAALIIYISKTKCVWLVWH
ncbi:hypothetical protein C8R45DRAFT_1111799 [Mycena sanguinolenta]|nr:hypothetical protein C8R45DRAFT_1111799 [Mycena sanguinolenta]